jgi:hypothetical protein
MKKRVGLAVAALVVAAAAGGFALADTGGGDSPMNDANGRVTTSPPDEPSVDGDEPATTGTDEEAAFTGLSKEDAIELAKEQDRLWRIAREDDTEYDHDAQLLIGRVTFEIDLGVVTAATIEADVAPPSVNWGPMDIDRANILVAGLRRLVTVDNTFGGGDVFSDIRIVNVIADDLDRDLHPLELEMIAAALQDPAIVSFIKDAGAEIDALFNESPAGVAILSVGDVRIEADRAELDLQMWCGSLCGLWITYELAPTADGWEVLGTVGPIAIS